MLGYLSFLSITQSCVFYVLFNYNFHNLVELAAFCHTCKYLCNHDFQCFVNPRQHSASICKKSHINVTCVSKIWFKIILIHLENQFSENIDIYLSKGQLKSEAFDFDFVKLHHNVWGEKGVNKHYVKL